jgi:hypothetical protein
MTTPTRVASVAAATACWLKHEASRVRRLAKAAVAFGGAKLTRVIERGRAPSAQRGRLFRKYAALLVSLVGGALLLNGAVEMYYAYVESTRALIAVQQEKAQSAAAAIEQFVKEIEGQVGWATGYLPAGHGLEGRQLDFLRLLRQAPAITEVSYIDAEAASRSRSRGSAWIRCAAAPTSARTRHSSRPGPGSATSARCIFARIPSPISPWHSRGRVAAAVSQ